MWLGGGGQMGVVPGGGVNVGPNTTVQSLPMAREFVAAYHRDAGTRRDDSHDAPTFSDGNQTLHGVFAVNSPW